MILKTMPTVRARLIVSLAIFLLAFGVRALTWHDTRLEVRKVQSVVVDDYQRIAQLLRDGGIASFFSRASPLADLNTLGHPPGYSLLIALIYSVKQSDAAIQFVQIFADALSVVMIFLIVSELLPVGAGVFAGLFAALSPQLAWNSVLLLPDSISVLPILLAIYLLTRAAKRPRLLTFILVGALVGVSCWLRANAMLLTVFIAAAVPLLRFGVPPSGGLPRKRGTPNVRTRPLWQFAIATIIGTLLIVLPLTIRNAIVFHRFIPLSLGAGQTFLEGIADYDKEGRFGIPGTDMGIMKQEAEIYQRPDYYGTLFSPDGVERERARLSRGFAVIRSHPIWFAGVMAKRASSMVRLERARLLSLEPAFTHSLARTDLPNETSAKYPEQLAAEGGTMSKEARAFTGFEAATLDILADSSTYGDQFASPEFALKRDTDYLAVVPMHLWKGRMRVSVRTPEGKVYASVIVQAIESAPQTDRPEQPLLLPFVARDTGPMQIVFSNEASNPPRPGAQVQFIKLYELGPARFLWTRYPRFIIRAIQKIYLTAVILPMTIIGLLLVVFRKQSAALVILSIVPIYFFCVQSIVHTEYRYVLAVVYFLFAFAGVAIDCGVRLAVQKLRRLSKRSSSAIKSVPSA